MTNPSMPDQKRRAGRPVTVDGRRVQVYLDKQSIDAAKQLGSGNVSAGIRIALVRPDPLKPEAEQE